MAAKCIVEGTRPLRPAHSTFTDNLWALAERCWSDKPHLRPGVAVVLEDLRGV